VALCLNNPLSFGVPLRRSQAGKKSDVGDQSTYREKSKRFSAREAGESVTCNYQVPQTSLESNMNGGLVSVIIPAFNAESYIGQAIDSVLQQTYQNVEIIVIDDGSADNTVAVIEGYNNPRIKVLSQNNAGAAQARNLGVTKAAGDWIAFLDADDLWLPEKLQKQLENIGDKVWSHTDLDYIGNVFPEGTLASDFTRKSSGKVFESILIENSIGTSSVLIKKNVFEEFGGFDTGFRALQDWDLWLRLSSKHEISYCPEPLVHYLVHSKSTSRQARKTLPYHLNLIEKVFSTDGVAKDLRHLRRPALAHSHNICSQISEQEGDYTLACYCAANTIFYQPLDFSRYLHLAKILVKTLLHYLTFQHKREA
jgi:glycosyltransferase involved in cell wall biosynthesis